MKASQERVLRELTQDDEFHKRQKDKAFAGFHTFTTPGDQTGEVPTGGSGSFEVFYGGPDEFDGVYEIHEGRTTGWYWWPCFPGCMPDGDPSGPFPTAEGAYLDAIGE